MGVLQRSVLRQFVPPFFFAIAVLAFVLLMDRLFLLADLLVRKGVAPAVVAEVAALSLPFVISITAPLGSLIAGVMTFGRMSQDNEVQVVRAAGVPVLRLVWPVFAVCALLIPAMAAFNGYAVPEAQHRARNLLTDVARKKPALRVRERVFMDDFPGYMAYIGRMEQRRSTVSNVVIFDRTAGSFGPAFVTAPAGDLVYTPDGRYMILTLTQGEMHEQLKDGTYRRVSFDRHVINVPVDDDLVRRDREYRSDNEMLSSQILGQLATLRRGEQELRVQLRAAQQDSQPEETRAARVRDATARLHSRSIEAGRYEAELLKRYSLAFSCLLFVVFGAPLGLLLRRGGVGTGFVVGLVFFGVYYVLMLAGQNLADSGRLSPFVGTWLPNLVLVLPVMELLTRALFERSPLLLLRRLSRSG